MRQASAALLLCAGIAVFALHARSAKADEPPASSAAQAPDSAAAGQSGSARKFDISEFDVEGNTVLTDRDIERAVYPFLGPNRTMSDIDGARAALEKAYAARGYQTVYVVIPPQTVRGGVVLLQAVEARIGKVAVKGAHYSTAQQIRAGVPTLTEGAVPDLHELNKELVQLNSQRGDLQVTPQMAPGSQPQTIDVNLDVTDHVPVHGGVELNNRYSRDTEPLRLQANLSYDDLWRAGHSLSVLYSVAPQRRADGEVYAVTYAAPLADNGLKLSLTGLKSNSNVNTVGSLDVLGKGESATLTATEPLGTVGSYFHYLQAGWAYKHFTNDTISGGQASVAPITYFPFSITYGGNHRGTTDVVTLSTALNFAFRQLGSDQAHYDFSRYGASGDMMYLRTGATWLHNLPLGLDLFTEVDGQLANGPLITNEQFSIGGDGSVRGYLQSEGLGDDGLRGSVELRGPSLAPYLGSAFNDLRFVVFADAAHSWLRDVLPEQPGSVSMSSAGFGFTAQALHDLYATAFCADPLETTAYPGQGGVTHRGRPRFQFRLYSQF